MKKQIKSDYARRNMSIAIVILCGMLSTVLPPIPITSSTPKTSDVVNHDSLNDEQSQTSIEDEQEEVVIEVEERESLMSPYPGDKTGVSLIPIEMDEEEEVEIIEEEVYAVDLTDYEFDMLCRTIQLEAGYHSVEGQKNVLYVIFNRLCSERFPNSIEEIILAPNQFSVVQLDKFYTVEITDFTRENVRAAAKDFQYGVSAQGAIYFRSAGTFDWCEYLFTDEIGHNFYK